MSRDGRRIAFASGTRLAGRRLLTVRGGRARTLVARRKGVGPPAWGG